MDVAFPSVSNTDPQHLTLILVRHGQTLWNAQKRIMSRLDIALDETGQDQVSKATSFMDHYPVDRIISSPQLRVLETVSPLAKSKGLGIEIDPRLAEIRFDRWEGKVFDEIREDPVYKERRQNLQMEPHPEVETISEVMARTKSLLVDLSATKGVVVCASHMDVLKAMVTHIESRPLEDFFTFEIQNASPIVFSYDGQTWNKADA